MILNLNKLAIRDITTLHCFNTNRNTQILVNLKGKVLWIRMLTFLILRPFFCYALNCSDYKVKI